MAHIKSAKKSIRIIEEKRKRNRAINREIKTYVAKAEDLILNNELEPAAEAVKVATIALDKAVQKGIMHSHKAARQKSRLMKKLNAVLPAES